MPVEGGAPKRFRAPLSQQTTVVVGGNSRPAIASDSRRPARRSVPIRFHPCRALPSRCVEIGGAPGGRWPGCPRTPTLPGSQRNARLY